MGTASEDFIQRGLYQGCHNYEIASCNVKLIKHVATVTAVGHVSWNYKIFNEKNRNLQSLDLILASNTLLQLRNFSPRIIMLQTHKHFANIP